MTLQWQQGIRAGLLAGLIVIALARIYAMESIYSRTADEPAHLITGMEWWQLQQYSYEVLHPPLARALIAALPYLDGLRMPNPATECETSFVEQYRHIALHHEKGVYPYNCRNAFATEVEYVGDAERNLQLARMGNWLSVVSACLFTYLLASALTNPVIGMLSVAILTQLPTFLTHGGLATTDMLFSATLLMALGAWYWLTLRPGISRALLFGLTAGLCVCSKFSALMFLPAGALLLYACLPSRPPLMRLIRLVPWMAASAFLVIWAVYFFSVGTVAEVWPWLNTSSAWTRWAIIPAPEFWQGILAAAQKNEKGHAFYFMGEMLDHKGVWYFFPVLLLTKTPLAALALFALGAIAALRSHKLVYGFFPLFVALTLLLVMPTDINIGLRHILFALPFVAVTGALAWRLHRGITIGLIGVLLVESWLAHPEYLPYFNVLAGDNPAYIAVDSDYDWMQDDYKLLQFMREQDITHMTICPLGERFFDYHGFPDIRYACPAQPPTGWFAMRRTHTKTMPIAQMMPWLADHAPAHELGAGFLLYRFP